MKHKIIRISNKRQVTIPKNFFEALNFDHEAECILKDGDKFLEQFKIQSKNVRPAVEKMIAEADEIARNGKAISFDELFDREG